jgi:hypothetical protein
MKLSHMKNFCPNFFKNKSYKKYKSYKKSQIKSYEKILFQFPQNKSYKKYKLHKKSWQIKSYKKNLSQFSQNKSYENFIPTPHNKSYEKCITGSIFINFWRSGNIIKIFCFNYLKINHAKKCHMKILSQLLIISHMKKCITGSILSKVRKYNKLYKNKSYFNVLCKNSENSTELSQLFLSQKWVLHRPIY